MMHAKLSPSASHRWLHCAASVELNAPQTGSNIYADQGTAAHALLEMCMRLEVDPHKFLGTDMHNGHVVDDDMADAVGHALDYVASYLKRWPRAKVHIEKEVDPHKLLNCEPGHASGTPDLGIDNAAALELVLIDYKHGAGVPVEVGGNTQILQYIVAFVSQHLTRVYKKYRAVVIQPRSRHDEGPVREFVYTHEEVMEHAKRLKRRVIFIKKNPEQREAGDWCKWCRGAARCKTLATKALETAGIEFAEKVVDKKNVKLADLFPEHAKKDPKGLSDKELSRCHALADVLEAWIKAVRGEMLAVMLRGAKMKDWKLVYGRTTRSWKDDTRVINACRKLGIDIDDYSPRTLVGVPGIEAVLKKRHKGKKKDFVLPKALLALVARSNPALHVARADDPRKEVTRGQEFEGK